MSDLLTRQKLDLHNEIQLYQNKDGSACVRFEINSMDHSWVNVDFLHLDDARTFYDLLFASKKVY